MHTWMLFQPGAGLKAFVTAEFISDNEDVASGIVGFDGGSQSDVALRVA